MFTTLCQKAFMLILHDRVHAWGGGGGGGGGGGLEVKI